MIILQKEGKNDEKKMDEWCSCTDNLRSASGRLRRKERK
jgi:hypothetical protein